MKTIQLSEREISMIFSMLTPPYAVSDPHTDEFNELRNKVFYALRDAQNDESVSNRDELPEEKGASLQLRNLIRRRHAEWSDATFGNVGPVGPLKHLSKEALEAAAEPDDLSEWADMQFLLWDAQRRAGICDGEITAAMEEKLKVNMERQWPEPKDGETRLHIKEAGNSPVIQDAWVACSERMPEKGQKVFYYFDIVGVHAGYYDGDNTFVKENGGGWLTGDVTHWMDWILPAAPQQE
ncbi:dATP/dGTP pyrophosphohydrolase domain-containing protein [Citrobacter koseri]